MSLLAQAVTLHTRFESQPAYPLFWLRFSYFSLALIEFQDCALKWADCINEFRQSKEYVEHLTLSRTWKLFLCIHVH